jgi:signal transduction histidine kinase
MNHQRSSPQANIKTRRILVVDDEAGVRRLLDSGLTSRGFSVVGVADGPGCLAHLERAEQPDLILLDIGLPGMGGLEVLQTIRMRFDHDTMPVILISGLAESDDVVCGLKAGANDYVVKPLTLPVLFARVNVWVQVRENYLQAIQRNDELTRAEEELRSANVSLEQANKELESFSYTVSHDLRAPLRAIRGFTQIVIAEHTSRMAVEGCDMLRRVDRAGERMEEIINDLLKLAQVSRHELNRSAVDMSRMAAKIFAELRLASPQRAVDVRIDQGMTVVADARLLEITLDNLLGNAWKFTSKRADASIEFTSETQGPDRVFTVRDNGAGFNSEGANKLFGAFQRLHTNDEFPGTGIGLATVRRIIERHGGRVWAKSKEGAGATFSFVI